MYNSGSLAVQPDFKLIAYQSVRVVAYSVEVNQKFKKQKAESRKQTCLTRTKGVYNTKTDRPFRSGGNKFTINHA